MPETILAIVWSEMSGKRLPAELVEDEVGAVAQVEELEVVLQMRSRPSSRRS